MSEYLKVLAKRAKKWAEIIGEGKSLQRNITIKRYVRKGIPGEYRGLVWLSVSGGEEVKNADPDLYQKLLQPPHNKQVADVIKTDLPRTFPDNIFFNNIENQQHQLYNILLAFAHQNKTVGYCQIIHNVFLIQFLQSFILQGLNYIAGLLLLVTKNIYQHVTNVGLPWAVITTKWFVCLFAEVLPIETTLRIWDCLFYEGSKIIFRVALTLIKRNKGNLLACQDFTTLAECFKEITKDSIVLKCHDFMPGSLPGSTILKLRTKISRQRAEQNENKLGR
ncbi:Growth hormone-regulated TBC protein 1-A [Habropoda laboriosa]|uniref:Growth hormone-regulated TBC protein 1-A n=1 Tax=Habropoda laboriosa TaxID=597456 RepID=A0A0L7QME6_9HYME|nr:Growth hormone-regulated TBC protein 1-A [Habropoda laboriosa]